MAHDATETSTGMSIQKQVVERYIDGFRRTDHAQILSCLTDDVTWVLHGYKTVHGRDAFDAEIEGEGFQGAPTLELDLLIEEGGTVAVTGHGTVQDNEHHQLPFVFCEVFTFEDDAVRHLDTYHVWLQPPNTASQADVGGREHRTSG